MLFAGYQTSFCDYPGKIAGVIFVKYCNLDCWYCHNRETALEGEKNISETEILKTLEKRKGLLDAVVISGGEPTLYNDKLITFLKKLRLEFPLFLIKLDTNGTNPELLQKIIEKCLVDYIAMDVKAPIGEYKRISGCENVNTLSLKKSIEIIKNSGLEYTFRTTFVPELEDYDIIKIKEQLGSKTPHVVQEYREVRIKEKF